jgi:hypothetical protein
MFTVQTYRKFWFHYEDLRLRCTCRRRPACHCFSFGCPSLRILRRLVGPVRFSFLDIQCIGTYCSYLCIFSDISIFFLCSSSKGFYFLILSLWIFCLLFLLGDVCYLLSFWMCMDEYFEEFLGPSSTPLDFVGILL